MSKNSSGHPKRAMFSFLHHPTWSCKANPHLDALLRKALAAVCGLWAQQGLLALKDGWGPPFSGRTVVWNVGFLNLEAHFLALSDTVRPRFVFHTDCHRTDTPRVRNITWTPLFSRKGNRPTKGECSSKALTTASGDQAASKPRWALLSFSVALPTEET